MKGIVKKSIFTLVLMALAFGIVVKFNIFGKVFAKDTGGFYSESIFVREVDGNKDIISKNSDKKMYPASLTKIMTTVVALDYIDNLDEQVQMDKEIYQEMVNKNSSMVGFLGNEVVTYRDLIYGIMLKSGGEATGTIAKRIGGSIDNFVMLMNDRAAEMGMNSTHFTTPEGLDDENQYTTSEDLIKLLDYALDNSKFKKIYSSKEYSVSIDKDFIISSTLFSQTDNDLILGGKTGYTSDAGHCLSTYAEIAGKEYILVTMKANGNSPRENIAIEDHIKIYESIGR